MWSQKNIDSDTYTNSTKQVKPMINGLPSFRKPSLVTSSWRIVKTMMGRPVISDVGRLWRNSKTAGRIPSSTYPQAELWTKGWDVSPKVNYPFPPQPKFDCDRKIRRLKTWTRYESSSSVRPLFTFQREGDGQLIRPLLYLSTVMAKAMIKFDGEKGGISLEAQRRGEKRSSCRLKPREEFPD